MSLGRTKLLLIGTATLACCSEILACEPMVPLAKALLGPNFFRASIVWLLIAVTVKCASFVCFERRLPWRAAAGYLLVGNVLSTLIGVVISLPTATVSLLFLVPIYFVTLKPARRLAEYFRWQERGWRRPEALAGLAIGGVALTMFLFSIAQLALSADNYFVYWLTKFGMVTIALLISILLTALWEEWVVATMARARHPERSYLPAVMRANYVTFGVVLLVAAIEMLPKRLHSKGFIVSLLDFLFSS
jgi:hypothetical protein